MRYHKITYTDVNNGLGCRVTLWISGCTHHCKGCHNQETWSFESGRLFDDAAKEKLFEILSLPYVKGLTLSGGDPVDSCEDVIALLKEVKEEFPEKDVWLYTGYQMCELFENEILNYVDYVVDGKYVEEERDTTLAFRGSKNQKIWKMHKPHMWYDDTSSFK